MAELIDVFKFGLIFTLAATMALIAYRLIINTDYAAGLLRERDGLSVAVDRMQAMVIVLGMAAAYAAVVLGDMSIAGQTRRMPDVPPWLLNIVGISQAIYLGGKVSRNANFRRGE